MFIIYGMAVYGELIMIFYHQIVDILMVGIVPKVWIHYIIKVLLVLLFYSYIRFDDFSTLKLIRTQHLISLLLWIN